MKKKKSVKSLRRKFRKVVKSRKKVKVRKKKVLVLKPKYGYEPMDRFNLPDKHLAHGMSIDTTPLDVADDVLYYNNLKRHEKDKFILVEEVADGDGIDTTMSGSRDFRDHLDEGCDCDGGCIKCCTQLDFEALPIPAERKEKVNARHHPILGEVFDIIIFPEPEVNAPVDELIEQAV